ncbi:hypothetical protein CDAR_555691 [Caerostris darwini]|uniref:Uncharacterized protein n=1 Tax=Caerostris darwini TaxID=1538125 RepID=A0AAV4QVG8_9ARAC|nr:hypothetical protein CDAR_555691 [Caerostris darwini]
MIFKRFSRHHIQLFHPLKLGRFFIPSFGIAFLSRYHRPILHAAWRIPPLTTNKLRAPNCCHFSVSFQRNFKRSVDYKWSASKALSVLFHAPLWRELSCSYPEER